MIAFYFTVLMATTATAGQIESKLQSCFDQLGYEKFKVIGYSAASRTLIYEIDGEETIVLREDLGHKVTAAPNNACKPVDGGSIRKLAQAFIDKTKQRASQPGSQNLKVCADALKGLNLAGDAAVLQSYLRSSAGPTEKSNGSK